MEILTQPVQEQNPADGAYTQLGFNVSVDYAFNNMQAAQLVLSQMADNKANIMITVCSILLTLAVARINVDALSLPTILFVVFAIPALILAILCVMPASEKSQKIDGPSIGNEKFNPLFFMQFIQVPIGRFEAELERVMTDPQALYGYMSRDIYNAGKVLRIKYRFLRWSYICLLFGIFAGVVGLLFERMFDLASS